ncbi:MAG: glycosyltransferase family 87 protein [Candidatus Brocadiia bacterium]
MSLRRFCRWWERRSFRIAVYTFLTAVFGFWVISGTERVLCGSSEFMGFRQIVQVSLVLDRNPYETIAHVRAYGPSFAIMWAPFGLLPLGRLPDRSDVLASTTLSEQIQIGTAAAILLLTMAGMAVWSVKCIAGACGKGTRWTACFPMLVLLLGVGLMVNSGLRCETDVFVLMLVAGGMVLLFNRQRPWHGGFLLGTAAVFKLIPGLFGVYLLCRRKWRALGGMVLGGITFGLVLPLLVWGFSGTYARYRGWADEVLFGLAKEGPEAFIGRSYRSTNQSLTAAAVRYLSRYNAGTSRRPSYVNVADLAPRTARTVADIAKLAILLLLVASWLLPRSDCGAERERLLFALVPPGMLLLSPVSVGGHFAILAVSFGALAAYAFDHDGERQGKVATMGLLSAFLLTHLMASSTLKELSVATLGAVVVLGVTLYLVWLRRPATEPRTVAV